MSITEHPSRIAELPKEHGDGITVELEPQDGGTTVATIRDSVRSCSLSFEVPTRLAQERPDFLLRYLNHRLVQTLNGKPMQVGSFPNGHKNGSGTMPQ
ncbi:MAG: hypothetical protein PeribacterA2_0764 [Candidatus Peribacter riflensis]|uniref:Uncharacterized protein n=1 Tax=Candidatus Peribacter riflensis TaxID=1735162 RepID=A0A0S1SHJ9_9BACT|nr:MAG: hypothetical protein PeribacterA2_0764 [Candidatus Peribacter riflensis]ALM11232.1 MAG: hypothetical protein PeribacterB2_0766 [Candidatus Peribacter riflensis]ALM12335.1 MAG: hypothetical protein PeribacterC2_0766 [Candidatus Peribacter riflensis]ALM13437.1 MAG: hypothetical protein PeribacterD1_0766 [Candidatus Peribacter riflensis]ALM14536.1 MAG: hypothetical protein PeribacterD2_0764 [Candidatus Peribacter riflensis]